MAEDELVGWHHRLDGHEFEQAPGDGEGRGSSACCSSCLFLPPILPSIRVLSNESTLRLRWPKYWRFSISPSNEHPGLISLRMDWLDLLAVQGTLKSLDRKSVV